MKYPEPALGSAQRKLLQTLRDANGAFIEVKDNDRAMEKLWKKGYVRWQSGAKGVRAWAISKTGIEALDRKET